MSRSPAPLVASSVCLFALLVTLIPTLGRAQTAGHVVISEVMYDPPQAGTDTSHEWVELFNPTGTAVELTGWKFLDNNSQDTLPAFVLGPGAYLVIAATADGFAENYPGFSGNLVSLGIARGAGSIGNGLANGGDRVILRDVSGGDVDAMSYGADATFFSLPRRNDLAGHSLARVPPSADTDTAAEWFDQPAPSPGGPGSSPVPTDTVTFTVTSHLTPTMSPTATPTVTSTSFPDETATASPTSTTTATETIAPGSSTATPTEVATPSATATTAASWPRLLLSEVLYDPLQGGSDSNWEWVEIYNAGPEIVVLDGWRLGDASSQDAIPPFGLAPHAYLVVAAKSAEFLADHPGFTGNLVALGSPIGNGLSNTDDAVWLLAPDGTTLDALSYGDNTAAFAPPCPRVPAGQSLARVPAWVDTDAAADWLPQTTPNPGDPGGDPSLTPTPTAPSDATATPTLTATPTATAGATAIPSATSSPAPTATGAPTPTVTSSSTPTPTATPRPQTFVRLNELMPRPDVIDWNGDGQADAYDEWIEIVNLGPDAADLTGWKLDDILGGGSAAYTFPPDTRLEPGAFLVRYRTTTGVALNQDADTAHLLAPDGSVVDAFAYTQPGRDASFSRTKDGTGDWTDAYPPSPGQPNRPGPPTPTPTSTSTPKPTGTRTLTGTPTPTVTPTSSLTPTPVSTPSTAQPGDVVINEIMPNPKAVPDEKGEWFEVYNVSRHAIDLNGWIIKDAGSEQHRINHEGPLWLPPGGYLVMGRNADAATNGGVSVAYPFKSLTLGNSDDEIILVDGAGALINSVAYGGPGFASANGASIQLIRPDLDSTNGAHWRIAPAPWPGSAGDLGSPGAPNHTAQIHGYVYEDLNVNRARDAGEPGIANVLLSLDSGRTTRSIASGWYGFTDLAPGAYDVIETQPDGFVSTTSDRRSVTIALGELAFGPSFGEQRLPPTMTPTAGPSPSPTPFHWPRLMLSEVLYDASQEGDDNAYEWVEVFNPGEGAVWLAGWALSDNSGRDVLPATSVDPGEYLVIASTTAGFRADYPDFAGRLISLEGRIGNGLSNAGDVVRLLAPDGTALDAMSYGDNAAAFAPPCPGVPAGQSLARVPAWLDTDAAADWLPQTAPNPGDPAIGLSLTPTPTPTPTGSTGATGTPTPTATFAPTPGPVPFVRLNEILPRPDVIDWNGDAQADAYDEWIEIVNLGPDAADLTGWKLDDTLGGGSAAFTFPPGTRLEPGALLVRYRTTTGVALNQDADTAHLLAPDGSVVDAFAYTQPGRDASFSRMVDGTGAWTDAYPPSPGKPNLPGTTTPTSTSTSTPKPTGTRTPTAAPTFTPTPTGTTGPLPSVRLNEILPRPDAVDWDGNGKVEAYDEWIEVINLSGETIDLGGWALDDVAGGSAPHRLPPGTRLEPGAFLVRYRSITGVALNQDADTVRLLAPDGREVDAFSYRNPGRDASYSRTIDGTGDWTDTYPPSPGSPNHPGAPPPTRTPTATPAPTVTSTAVTYDRTAVRLNEVLPAPSEIDWNGDGAANADDEWVEIYNRGGVTINLGGWQIDDIAPGGSRPYVIPPGTVLQSGAFLLLDHGHTGVTLNNDGDAVRLLGPDAAEVDAFAYTNPKNDRSYSRSTDGDGAWTETYPPSPGRTNVAATPTPTPTATPTSTPFPAGVTLNEILPDPQRVDWDQDGANNFADEWIELYNAGPVPAALGGWAVMDDTKAYTLPMGLTIWPQSYLVLFRRETGLSLSDWRDRVTLVRPDGIQMDQYAYDNGPGADRSFCRSLDGTGGWTNDCEATPGEANRLQSHLPPGTGSDGGSSATAARPTRSLLNGTIAAARAAPDDTRVTVTGAVTLPPGLYGRSIYIQDATGGIMIYLRSGDYPALAAGDRVRVTGWTRQYHGELELSVPNPGYLTQLGPGSPPVPEQVATGRIGEAHEGQLVWMIGRVVRFEPNALIMDDGTGQARIFFPAELPWRRPYVQIGAVWSGQGVVGQYARAAPWEGGYRVIPRFRTDVSDAPLVLPVTGGGSSLTPGDLKEDR